MSSYTEAMTLEQRLARIEAYIDIQNGYDHATAEGVDASGLGDRTPRAAVRIDKGYNAIGGGHDLISLNGFKQYPARMILLPRSHWPGWQAFTTGNWSTNGERRGNAGNGIDLNIRRVQA